MNNFKVLLVSIAVLFFMNGKAQDMKADISHLSIPAADWNLTIDLKDFEVEKNNFDSDGNSRNILATIKGVGFTASVFIEKADHDGDYLECRNFYWGQASKSPLAKDNLTLYEKNEIAFVEHDTKEYDGKRVDYHSVNAYMSHGGYWIDIHVSKIAYKAADKEIFDKIFNSIKIEKPKVINISELFLYGAQNYIAQNYKATIDAFEPILETQKEKLTIDKTIWIVVVDNLGMSYGITGDFKNCKRIFDYGIKFYPEYPMFYFNLACLYAEQSDIDNALLNLQLAVDRKKNMVKEEEFPNPRNDSSFSKYLKDDKFKSFLKKNGL
jgi:tetratricopeptide (TPR) repeat protein